MTTLQRRLFVTSSEPSEWDIKFGLGLDHAEDARRSYQIDGHVLRTRAANFSASGLKRQDNDLILIKDAQSPAKFLAKQPIKR